MTNLSLHNWIAVVVLLLMLGIFGALTVRCFVDHDTIAGAIMSLGVLAIGHGLWKRVGDNL